MARRVLSPQSCYRLVLFAVVTLSVSQSADAKPPEIRNINLRGLQIGQPTAIIIDGTDLLPNPQIFLGAQPVKEITLDPTSTATRLVLSIIVPEATLTGIRSLRLATPEGFSNSLLVGVDRLRQIPIAEKTEALNVALHGSVAGINVSKTTFPGKAGEELIVEVEARRLGGKLRPVIHLYDSRRVQVAWAAPSNMLAGDARIVTKLPRDDQYTVEIHDTQYAPPGPGFFRLKIGRWDFADLVFPPAIARGQSLPVELLGNLNAVKVPVQVDDATIAAVPWSSPLTGQSPSITGSSFPELIEGPDGQPTPLPGVPVAVSGRLTAPGQRDRFLLSVPPNKKLLLEVFAERIGSRIDAVLEIRNKQNALVASNDDGPASTDPRLEYTVPADQDALELAIRDNLDLSGPAAVYRLVVTAVDSPLRQFEVAIKSDTMNVASGESAVLEVFALRQAYDGPIQLQFDNLPAGVVAAGVEIPAGMNGSLVTFTNNGDGLAPTVIRSRARSADGTITQPIRVETTPDDRSPAWMREQLAVANTPKFAAPFVAMIVNETTLAQLAMASKPTFAVKVVRPPDTYGPVRLSLVTSQPPIKVNGQPNLPQMIRAEKPVEIPIDNMVKAAGDALVAADKLFVEAVKVAQSAQGDAKVAADAKVEELKGKRTAAETALREAEAKAVYQTDYAIFVPSTLAESQCDVSIRAELLNPERNTVLRTTWTPVKRIPSLNPLVIKLAGPTPLDAPLDPKTGAVVKVTGTIERLAGYTGDVTLSVTGLPAGVAAPNVAVKAADTAFTVEVRIPANFAGTEIPDLKLIATGPPDPQSGNIPVKSVESAVVIKVTKGPA
ncbi:MAG: hypothetical protein WCJ09_21825 [Planctomycetota bacterium]